MTLRCNRSAQICGGLLALLAMCCAPMVIAQDDGTQPPNFRARQGSAQDADFQTPQPPSGANGDQSAAKQRMREQFREQMRKRRMQMQNGDNPGGFAGGDGPEGMPGRLGTDDGQGGFRNRLGGGDGPGGLAGPGAFRRRAGGFDGPGGGQFGGPGGPGGGQFGGPGGPGGPAGQGFGGGRMRNMQMGMPGHKPLDLTPLNLTDNQKQRIQDVRKGTREKAREMKRTVMQRQLQLRSLLFSADASDAKIRAARRELRQAQDQLDEINLDDMLSIRGMLTAEQKQKLPDLAPGAGQGGFGPRGGAELGARGFGPDDDRNGGLGERQLRRGNDWRGKPEAVDTAQPR